MTPCSQSRKEAAGPTPLLAPRKTQDRSKRITDLQRNKDNDLMEQCIVCKRYYLKGRGLKIHQKKAGCFSKLRDPHRKLCKSAAAGTQETNHSGTSSQVDPLKVETTSRTTMSGKNKAEGDPGKATKEREEVRLEEEIKIQEEDLYEEVRGWIQEINKDSHKNEKREAKEKPKARESEKSHDIRNWLGIHQQTKEEKGKVKIEDSGEDDSIWSPNRRVIVENKKKKEGELKKTKEARYCKKGDCKSEDLRAWLKTTQKHEGDKREVRVKETKTEADTRIVVEEKSKPKETRVKEEQNKVREGRKGSGEKVDIQKGPAKEVLARHGINLTRRDFKSLTGKNYLNDKIIDQYMKQIERRNQEDPNLPKAHACTTFLYTQLKRYGVKEGCKETENWTPEDFLEYDLIFFPIHHQHHWSLIVVETEHRTVHYFDSLIGSRHSSAAPRTMKMYMEEQHKKKGEETEYTIKVRKDAPLQYNGVDCGVFVCQYAERVARRSRMDFTQKDMKEARDRMIEELMKGEIAPDWGSFKIWRQTDAVEHREEGRRGKTEKGEDTGRKPEKAKNAGNKARKGNTERPRKAKEKVETDTQKGKARTEGDRKERIAWPKANSPEWERLDENLTQLLKAQCISPENSSVVHPALIYTFSLERFGEKGAKKKEPQTKGPSKRQAKCKRLRQEINLLKQAYQEADDEKKEAVKQLQEEKLRQLRLAKRAESTRKRRKRFAKNCNEFLSHPFEFAKSVIAPNPKGTLESSKEEVEKHLTKSHSKKENEEEEKSWPEDIVDFEPPEVDYDNSLPTLREFSQKLRKTRNNSAPGPNGVPYLVYKRCPGVARLLYAYLKGMWRKNTISRVWRTAEGIFIPKVDGAKDIGKFRTISLLNVEGKLFFAMKADRLTGYVMANRYIDSSIQKGGIPGVSGCMEHTAILSQLIKEAKEGKKDLVVTWLDIANAYGTIPHSLILKTLKRAHVPEDVCDLVESYYADVKIRFTTRDFTTEWQKVEKGIVTGCTLSVILFALTMTLLVASAKKATKGPKSETGQRQENCRLFMDDIATTTEKLVQTKYLLDSLAAKLEWAGLDVKAEKCRSLVLVKGEVSKKEPMINGIPIVSVADSPIKYLGKTYDRTLTDREQAEETLAELQRTLEKLERCQVPGRYKAWMVEHMVLPRLLWPMTIYAIPATKVKEMQRRITAKLKKWLGLPRSLSVECFYSKSAKLQLPFSELTEEVRAAKARLHMTLQESEDPCIKNAAIEVDGGRKENTAESVKEAKERLRMEEVVGIPNKGKEGLGLTPKRYYSQSKSKHEKRGMVVEKVREAEEDRRRVKMTGLARQGGHMGWEVPERRITARDIVLMPEDRFRFLVKSVYDLLPTPQNKKSWFGEPEECKLCGGCGSLAHILSGCSVALAQGRYTWRHDQVLKEIAACVEVRRKQANETPKEKERDIKFVRPGEKRGKSETRVSSSYLDGATDWNLSVDLNGRLKFPASIAETNLRPDMLLVSEKAKRVGIVELTVPSEERVELSGELKKAKYEELKIEGERKGWRVRIWTVEVGCRGFPATSMANFLRDIGVGGGERSRSLKRIGEAAERCSKAIWNWSCIPGWGKG